MDSTLPKKQGLEGLKTQPGQGRQGEAFSKTMESIRFKQMIQELRDQLGGKKPHNSFRIHQHYL